MSFVVDALGAPELAALGADPSALAKTEALWKARSLTDYLVQWPVANDSAQRLVTFTSCLGLKWVEVDGSLTVPAAEALSVLGNCAVLKADALIKSFSMASFNPSDALARLDFLFDHGGLSDVPPNSFTEMWDNIHVSMEKFQECSELWVDATLPDSFVDHDSLTNLPPAEKKRTAWRYGLEFGDFACTHTGIVTGLSQLYQYAGVPFDKATRDENDSNYSFLMDALLRECANHSEELHNMAGNRRAGSLLVVLMRGTGLPAHLDSGRWYASSAEKVILLGNTLKYFHGNDTDKLKVFSNCFAYALRHPQAKKLSLFLQAASLSDKCELYRRLVTLYKLKLGSTAAWKVVGLATMEQVGNLVAVAANIFANSPNLTVTEKVQTLEARSLALEASKVTVQQSHETTSGTKSSSAAGGTTKATTAYENLIRADVLQDPVFITQADRIQEIDMNKDNPNAELEILRLCLWNTSDPNAGQTTDGNVPALLRGAVQHQTICKQHPVFRHVILNGIKVQTSVHLAFQAVSNAMDTFLVEYVSKAVMFGYGLGFDSKVYAMNVHKLDLTVVKRIIKGKWGSSPAYNSPLDLYNGVAISCKKAATQGEYSVKTLHDQMSSSHVLDTLNMYLPNLFCSMGYSKEGEASIGEILFTVKYMVGKFDGLAAGLREDAIAKIHDVWLLVLADASRQHERYLKEDNPTTDLPSRLLPKSSQVPAMCNSITEGFEAFLKMKETFPRLSSALSDLAPARAAAAQGGRDKKPSNAEKDKKPSGAEKEPKKKRKSFFEFSKAMGFQVNDGINIGCGKATATLEVLAQEAACGKDDKCWLHLFAGKNRTGHDGLPLANNEFCNKGCGQNSPRHEFPAAMKTKYNTLVEKERLAREKGGKGGKGRGKGNKRKHSTDK